MFRNTSDSALSIRSDEAGAHASSAPLPAMPRLYRIQDIKKDLRELPDVVCTTINNLSSQGLSTSFDQTVAMFHGSSSPPNYYIYSYGIEGGLNMDRGAFGQGRDGTNFGCVFDGVTAGGCINAYAAQAFAEYTISWLAENHTKFASGSDINDQLAKTVMLGATQSSNNPARRNPKHEAEGGSATGVLVTFEPRSKSAGVLNGAAIGDAAVIVVHVQDGEGVARLLHKPRRRDSKDTGGQLTMCMGVNGEVWTFSEAVTDKALVILTTDGFTDNIHMPQLDQIVPLLVRATALDEVPSDTCPLVVGSNAHLPKYEELLSLFGEVLEPLMTVTCVTASQRLSNYLTWVTRPMHCQEQEFYYSSTVFRKLTESGADTSVGEGRQLTEQMEHLRALRKNGTAGKTDDALIMVMHPFHRRCEVTLHPQPAAQMHSSSAPASSTMTASSRK